jgi:hypothetical protein
MMEDPGTAIHSAGCRPLCKRRTVGTCHQDAGHFGIRIQALPDHQSGFAGTARHGIKAGDNLPVSIQGLLVVLAVEGR